MDERIPRNGVVGILPREVRVTLTADQVNMVQMIITDWVSGRTNVERLRALTIRKILGEADRG